MNKIISSLVTISFFVNSMNVCAQNPIANDCTSAIPITPDTEGHYCAYSHSFNLNDDGTTASGLNNSCSNGLKDKYFTWTATSTGLVWYDQNYRGLVVSIYENIGSTESPNCGALIACDGDEIRAGILKGWDIGDDLIISVATTSSSLNFCIQTYSIVPPPSNNNCSGALTLNINPDMSCSSFISSTTQYSERTYISSCTGLRNDVWYKFTATSYSHYVELSNLSQTNNALTMQVFSGDCYVLNEIYCEQFYSNNNGVQGKGINGLTPNQTYYIRMMVDSDDPLGYSSFNICLGTIINDYCISAENIDLSNLNNETCINIPVNQFQYSTSSNVANTCSDGYGYSNELWYEFTAKANNYEIRLNTNNSYSNSIQVLENSCQTLTPVACSVPSGSSKLRVSNLIIDNSYYLRIQGRDPSSDLSLCINRDDPQIISCDTILESSYCYTNNDDKSFNYTSADPLQKISYRIKSGGIESCCDRIVIYNGNDGNAPILFQSYSSILGDTTIVSSGSEMFVQITSDGSQSCGNNNLSPIVYEVSCKNNCPSSLSGSSRLNGSINTKKSYMANGLIESEQSIQPPADIHYGSKTAIELMPGFNIDSSAQFKADLNGCNE